MFYPLPRKIQLAASTSNWYIESTQSILLLVGLDDLEKISDWAHQPLADHLEMLSKRAQALEIPVMMIQSSQLQQYVTAWAALVIKHSGTGNYGGEFITAI